MSQPGLGLEEIIDNEDYYSLLNVSREVFKIICISYTTIITHFLNIDWRPRKKDDMKLFSEELSENHPLLYSSP